MAPSIASAVQRTPLQHDGRMTGRLEAFSDGVFAIAATLLILDVKAEGLPLGPALLGIWPS